MKGYSKIQLHGSTKSRSMDFSDLTHHLPQAPRKPIKTPKKPSMDDQEAKQIKTHETHLEEDQETKQIKTHETHLEEDQEPKQIKTHETHLESGEEDDSGERFGVILSRNYSVSSTASASSSHRFRFDKEQKQENSGSLQSAVKRAFSMRRSSSVAERYSKIHDQYVTLSSSFQEDDGEEDEEDKNKNNNTVMKMKKKNQKPNKILKACKRIFGL